MARKANPTTRFYDLRPGNRGYARFWITDDGCLSCISDYGNYAYWWGAPGLEFREFLIACDTDYVARKLCGERPDEFDGEQTADNIRDCILRRRRHMSLGRDEARREWNEVPKEFDSSDDFAHWMHRTKLEDAWEFSSYCVPRRVQAFMKHVWPALIEKLKHELASEEAA